MAFIFTPTVKSFEPLKHLEKEGSMSKVLLFFHFRLRCAEYINEENSKEELNQSLLRKENFQEFIKID